MKLEIIPTKGILYDKCENIEQLYDNFYFPLLVEFKDLKKQLEYLRSGEYLNQLKFERNMLENIVQNMEVSKEDKEFIDMTHRNTELLEENQELKDRINKAVEYINDLSLDFYDYECEQLIVGKYVINDLLDLLKEDNKEKVDE